MADGDSIVRRVNGERLTVLGWGRAILMQLAHPLIAAGVAGHSDFRQGPLALLGRLRGTVGAMLALTFGDEAESAAAAEGIRRIHDRVHGRLSSDVGRYREGTPYSAHDPALLLWVHATLLESVLGAYVDLVGPLSDDERNTYLDEAADGSVRIGMPASLAPRTVPALTAYLDGMVSGGCLAASSASRVLADAVLHPSGGWMLFPATRFQTLLTVGTLPVAIREMYGFEWSPRDERRLRRAQAGVRRLRALAPESLARFRAGRSQQSV